MSKIRVKGMALVIFGSTLWGISGTVSQFLFQNYHFSPEWLTVTRLLTAGFLLIFFAYKQDKRKIFGVFKNKQDALGIVVFSILGMLAVQYTYLAAIQASNAATATVLQYLGPILVECYITIRAKRLPTLKEIAAVALALLGTFLLVTHGNFGSLSISGQALFWGLASAFASAFYTLEPKHLLAKWGSKIVVGWGMFIGGFSFSFIHPLWKIEGKLSLSSGSAILFVILFGTLIAFYCYLESMRYITAVETSVLACVEPLSAALFSVLWLHVAFGPSEWLGTLAVIITIIVFSTNKEQKAKEVHM